MNERKCVLCEATFREKAMVGDKCKKCHEKRPDVKSKEELREKNKRDFIAELINEGTIQQMIYDTLEDAGLKREVCDCGNKFFKRSPSQKQCKTCAAKK